jgi:anaerobic selenocysteine-containing dehydrogenase
VGFGFSRSRNGATNLHAVSCLPAVTGAWRERGGGALWGNGAIYHLDKTLSAGLDHCDTSVRELDQCRIGPVLTGDRRDLGDGPPVTALLIQNTNPLLVCPESAAVRQGFLRDDLFTVVHEQFMTDTAAMADIVLPATMFLEHDDFYTSSGHTHLQIARRVVEPPGQCRSNHELICALAQRLGAEHPGFHMTSWELIDAIFRASGHPSADQVWDQGGFIDCAESFERAHFLDGFPQPDDKFHFRADWARVGPDHAGMPALPGFWPIIEQADERHPYRLVAAPSRGYLNTSFNETPGSQRREGRPTAMIHPSTCAALGLAVDDRVRLGNQRGSVVVHALPFDGVQPEVVVVEGIHPGAAFEEGMGINDLVGADPGKPNGGGVFHDTAIWMRKA